MSGLKKPFNKPAKLARFIVNNSDKVYFVHSSYVDPFMVVKETALDSKILQTSAYRVLGKITADDELIKGWLLKKEIVTGELFVSTPSNNWK
jgi:hypothetical protein